MANIKGDIKNGMGWSSRYGLTSNPLSAYRPGSRVCPAFIHPMSNCISSTLVMLIPPI